MRMETASSVMKKDALVATLTTDEDGKAEIGELPLGSYYLKETTAGDHFVLNPEQKEFTLSAEDDTVSVVYEGVTYKNERQKIQNFCGEEKFRNQRSTGGCGVWFVCRGRYQKYAGQGCGGKRYAA